LKKIAIPALVLGLVAVSPAWTQTTPPATPHAGTSKAMKHDADMKKRMGEMKAQHDADMKTHDAEMKAHHDAEVKTHLAKAKAHHAAEMKKLKARNPATPPAQ
jgi:hypothetical protein